MPIKLTNGKLFTPTEVLRNMVIVVSDDGRLSYVGSLNGAPVDVDWEFDLDGKTIIPGLIDIHVHGGYGINFGLEITYEQLNKYSLWVASTGVCGFLCSIFSPNTESLTKTIQTYVTIFEAGLEGAEGLGLHLEGPYLSKEKKGAFNPEWLQIPNPVQAKVLLDTGKGWIRQISIAPELPGANRIASMFHQAGVIVALGHSNADFDVARDALNGNFSHVTHTFNAQKGFDHRQPGVVGAVLSSEKATAELISDAIHVHPGAMKVLLRCLGTDRVILITDAISGAGFEEGSYELAGNVVNVKNGKAMLENGTLAGSTGLLNENVSKINKQVGVALHEAVKMASLNPARMLGISDRLGSLSTGKNATLAVIDDDVEVYLTMVKGKIIYNRL